MAMTNKTVAAATPFVWLWVFLSVVLQGAHGQGLPTRHNGAEGKRIYEKANCIGCHKWHGEGGGGYGGAALSLRRTELDRDQIIEVIRCGRPHTGMPYHLRGAYDEASKPCFGLSRQDLAALMPPEATHFLRQTETEAVADYVLANIKGKGEVTHADCAAFFGTESRLCHIYRTQSPGPQSEGSGATGPRPER
jgi:mono/diheme cytochrome c family protein